MAKGVTILAVGQKHDRDLVTAIATYETRLRHAMPVSWRILQPSQLDNDACRRAESLSVLQELRDEDFIVLLDERGTQLSSEAFSGRLHTALVRPVGRVVCVIGGAYGVDDTVRSRADLVVSLSTMVFPHQLVRLILVEQLYRAHTIAERHPYHHS